jgi:hypothetical protein
MAIGPLPRRFCYRERDGKTVQRGFVTAEDGITECYPWGDYKILAQILEYENGWKALRFAYYVKDHDASDAEYKWGSQTTLIVLIENAEGFLRKAQRLLDFVK